MRVLAGPNAQNLTHIKVNDDAHPFEIHSEFLDALIVVRIRDFSGLQPDSKDKTEAKSSYFDSNADQYSIQVRMKFKKDIKADDMMLMNAFDTPIKHMPPGAGLAVKSLSWIDPGLESDIHSSTPYIRSPLLVTMNKVHAAAPSTDEKLTWPSSDGHRIEEDVSALVDESERAHLPTGDSKARRTYLANKSCLSKCNITNGTIIDCDFFNAYIDFNHAAIKMPGFSIPVLRFWDGESCLNYIAATRPKVEGDLSTADVYWVVRFELVNMDQQERDAEADDFLASAKRPQEHKAETNKDPADSLNPDVD